MTEEAKYKLPKPTVKDAAHALTRAGLGAIPLVGSTAIELFSALLKTPLERRRNEWMENVALGLQKLEQQYGLILEELSHNEAFIDSVTEATQAAIRTSQQEKLDALRNSVLNSALPNPPEQFIQHIFINLIDTFTFILVKEGI